MPNSIHIVLSGDQVVALKNASGFECVDIGLPLDTSTVMTLLQTNAV